MYPKTVQEFNTIILDKRYTNKLIIVDFFATWCGPCKKMSPIVDELAKKYTVIKIDVENDTLQDIILNYKITSFPTFAFIKNKKVLGMFSGADINKLNTYINNFK